METIYPNKLRRGDNIAVISPGYHISTFNKKQIDDCVDKFIQMGLNPIIKNDDIEIDSFKLASLDNRIKELHDAFLDSEIKGIMCMIGGYNSNQLLDYIDYKIIKSNPKFFCGYSNITVLTNAIYKKTGLVTFSGPNFSSFGMRVGFDYTLEYFKKVIFSKELFIVEHSEQWSDDEWYIDQDTRIFYKNDGPKVLNPGNVTGKAIGGNLCSFNLLQGTPYMPDLKDTILFLEETKLVRAEEIDQYLQSLIHLPDFKGVKALVFGRFQKETIDSEVFRKIINSKEPLKKLPIVYDLDFGHTSPKFTFPIGGDVRLNCEYESGVQLEILSRN